MKRRKRIIIDKKFQFKTTFSIIGLVTLLAAIIVAAIAISVVYNNHRIERINVMEDTIVQYLQVKSIMRKSADLDEKAMKQIAVNHSGNMKAMSAMIRYNKILLAFLIVFVIGQGVILFLVLIRKTHQIAGPVYVMTGYLQDMIAGKYPTTRSLRKKDELQNFYSLFCKMLDAARNKDKK
ncbi:MAG: hypothetical protein A2W19_07300 [Spirochaetes bacterium RBG_16_49_21]|nr:MAG: hypothetical protein A2W19_07300 [Spirochaetes bacterium RBG_16_49_21]